MRPPTIQATGRRRRHCSRIRPTDRHDRRPARTPTRRHAGRCRGSYRRSDKAMAAVADLARHRCRSRRPGFASPADRIARPAGAPRIPVPVRAKPVVSSHLSSRPPDCAIGQVDRRLLQRSGDPRVARSLTSSPTQSAVSFETPGPASNECEDANHGPSRARTVLGGMMRCAQCQVGLRYVTHTASIDVTRNSANTLVRTRGARRPTHRPAASS